MIVIYKDHAEGTLAKYKCVGRARTTKEEEDKEKVDYNDEKPGCGLEFEGVQGPSQGHEIIDGERIDIPTACPRCSNIYVKWMNYEEMHEEWKTNDEYRRLTSTDVDSVEEN